LRVSGHQVVVASAPTTKAARWLAKSGRNVDGNTVHELPGLLANLPLGCLDWPVNVQQQLLQMGIRTLGECRRLPRDGFARRIGPGYLLELDQGFGACPDLMLKHHEPETFDDEIDLVSESRATTEIIGALTELLERLSASLSCRQVSVEHLSVCMSHCGKAPTYLELSLREPGAATDYFMELLQLQLDRQVLPAPVTNIAVRARFTQTYQVATADLLSTALHGDASISLPGIGVAHDDAPGLAAARLVERLRTRLGMQHVYGLELVAEHRPERAWRVREPLSGHASQSGKVEFVSRRRPLWLLAKPRRLNCQQDKPLFRGELLISDNAERIESGWWDGNDVRRDYYMASGHTGCRYWIYRDRRSARWYLHGLFG